MGLPVPLVGRGFIEINDFSIHIKVTNQVGNELCPLHFQLLLTNGARMGVAHLLEYHAMAPVVPGKRSLS
jgi:hypothetical protein